MGKARPATYMVLGGRDGGMKDLSLLALGGVELEDDLIRLF
jgi:hypothetical protein